MAVPPPGYLSFLSCLQDLNRSSIGRGIWSSLGNQISLTAMCCALWSSTFSIGIYCIRLCKLSTVLLTAGFQPLFARWCLRPSEFSAILESQGNFRGFLRLTVPVTVCVMILLPYSSYLSHRFRGSNSEGRY